MSRRSHGQARSQRERALHRATRDIRAMASGSGATTWLVYLRTSAMSESPGRIAPLGRCSAGPTEGSLALNISAVSSWGCLLYSFFCVSTARLLVAPRPQEPSQSEHRQDTDPTARSCERDGAGCCYWFLIGGLVVAAGVEVAGRSVGSARLPRAVHRRGTCLVRQPCSPEHRPGVDGSASTWVRRRR